MRAVVVGTGSMGPEIAAAFATAELETAIAGRDAKRADAAAALARSFAGSRAVRAAPIAAETFADADLVLETIVEDLPAKHEVLARIEGWCRPDTLIATNTSSLRIADIAAPLAHPGRFAGLHFLKPAHLTAVVELIPGPETDDATTTQLRGIAARMGKAPLVAQRDVPGFIWNRIQFAVLRECLHMLETGVASAEDIDAAVADGLAPRWVAAGPLATADLGGLATFARICDGLFPHLATDTRAPEAITRPAEAGDPLQRWTRSSAEAIQGLRADSLAAGREIAERRRRLAG
jgi:3-hydroxybutyryl-CoA dehydrogenase